MTDTELHELERELYLRETDPLTAITLTQMQREAVESSSTWVLLDGGNQSGKTLTACYLVAMFALGLHRRAPRRNRVVWYSTTTFAKFGEQAWKHFKRLLLWENEPLNGSRRIASVRWMTSDPESPIHFRVTGADGFTTDIYIRSYTQEAEEFAGAQPDLVVLDEECKSTIVDEVRARLLANPGAFVVIPATPVLGVQWLQKMRDQAVTDRSISHHRLMTMDNPGRNDEIIRQMQIDLRDRPEELRLRLEGIPYASSGLVYALRHDHICEPFYLDPGYWCFRRTIDHGWRTCACVWSAVHKSGDDIIIYRSYHGNRLRIAENAATINGLGIRGQWTGGAERYARTLIDPATAATDSESGITYQALWAKAGINAKFAPDNRVGPGVEKVRNLLAECGGVDGRRPRLRIFSTCHELITEMRNYHEKPENDDSDRDQTKENPVKREDHCCDCLRYDVAAGLNWVPPPAPKLDLDPVQKAFHDMKRPKVVGKL